MKPVLSFDLNGTLTDTSALNPIFMRYFGQAERRHEWFAQLIELAMTCAATAEYIPFGKLADAALRMLDPPSGSTHRGGYCRVHGGCAESPRVSRRPRRTG